ncbi:MAG TPA: hypothetical protein VF222_09685 [Nitrososphaeraceae archaeon]
MKKRLLKVVVGVLNDEDFSNISLDKLKHSTKKLKVTFSMLSPINTKGKIK